jgi:hypothetical protein
MIELFLQKKEEFRKVLFELEKYYDVTQINLKAEPLLSIVMTSSERSNQTYFTLDSMQTSVIADKIHIVLVDDSVEDPILPTKLETFGLFITFIKIRTNKKFWINPCVNYNIGFKFILGSRIIIQNAEVCHVGDICAIAGGYTDDDYYTFDVLQTRDFEANEKIYIAKNIEIGVNDLFRGWCEHHTIQQRHYHYLATTSAKSMTKIGGFSLDYTMAAGYDDDDFKLRIKASNIKLISVPHTIIGALGIHLYHNVPIITSKAINQGYHNNTLFFLKEIVMNGTNLYFDITSDFDLIEIKANLCIEYVKEVKQINTLALTDRFKPRAKKTFNLINQLLFLSEKPPLDETVNYDFYYYDEIEK